MRPQELQIEVPYAGDINPEFYAQKPCARRRLTRRTTGRQSRCSPIPCSGSPRPQSNRKTAPGSERSWRFTKRTADAIFAGEIHPVGQEPDGKAFTGLLSHNAETGKAYLILYREAGAEAEKAELLLPQTRASQWKRIAGSGSVATGETGKIGVTMPRASYLMLESV